jgi:hypothetical protein
MSWFLDWSELRVGGMYFLLAYHDQQRLFPYIETLIYLGAEAPDQNGDKHHAFAYANSETIVDGNRQADEEEMLRFVDTDPSCIGDLDGLIKELQQCRMRLGSLT